MANNDENIELYQALLQESEDGVFVMDEGKNITFWNKGSENIWGYTSSEMIGKNIDNYITNIGQEMNEWGKEVIILQKDGTKTIASLSMSQTKKEGKFYSMAIVKEISNQKEVYNVLNSLKNSIDSSFAQIEFDPKGNILEVNQNFANILEYDSKEELLKKHHTLLIANKLMFSKEYIEFWSKLKKGIIQKGEFRRISKKGKQVWLQAIYTPIKNQKGEVVKIINIAMDITSQKEAIHHAEGLKYAIDGSFAQIEFSEEGKILEVNQKFMDVFGYDTEKEVIGRHHSLFIEKQYKSAEKKFEKFNENAEFWRKLREGITQNGEFKQINKKGEPVWTAAAYTPIKNSFGEVVKVVQIAVDITDQKRMVLDIQGLKDTIDVSFAQIEFDSKGNILDVNQNFTKLLEYETKDDLIGKHHAIFVDEEYKASEEYGTFWEDLENGERKQGEFMRITQEGNTIWLLGTYTPVKDLNGEVTKVIQIVSDISAQNRNCC